MSHPVLVKYTGSSPTGANTYTLFSTVTAFSGANMAQNAGLNRLEANLKHSQALTLKMYKSNDRGVTWEQVADTGSIAAPGATSSTNLDWLIEAFPDFKLDLLNGGVDQANFSVNIALADSRNPSA